MILDRQYAKDQLKPPSDAWLKNWKGGKITIDDIAHGRGCIVKMRPGELHGKAGVAEPAAKVEKRESVETVFKFGKHRGESFADVWASNPGYIRWCCGEIKGFAAKVKAAGIDVDGEEEEDIDIFA